MGHSEDMTISRKKDRNEFDFYQTPHAVTRQLLDTGVVPAGSHILEPASGGGAIVKVLKERGFETTYGDLQTGYDFFNEDRKFDVVLANPPYSLAAEFILKAKEIAKDMVVFILPLNYFVGKRRFETIWTDKEFPLYKVYTFSRYIYMSKFIVPSGRYESGMRSYCWYVWKKGFVGEPTIQFLDNSQYILHAGDEGYVGIGK